MTHWIIVADKKAARIYHSDATFERFGLVRTLRNSHVHPDADELGGRGATQSGPGGSQSRFERHTDPEDAERSRFAKEVAHVLTEGHQRKDWERLVLVAPPKLLGDLREALPADLAKHLVASIDKELTQVPEHELAAAVRERMPPLAGYGA